MYRMSFHKGVQGFSLSSSPSSGNDHISACPNTTVTLTCTASGVATIGWRDQNREIGGFNFEDHVSSMAGEDPYSLTLVAKKNVNSYSADLTSTLEVMVDDIANGTNISCVIYNNQKHLIIYITGYHVLETVYVTFYIYRCISSI